MTDPRIAPRQAPQAAIQPLDTATIAHIARLAHLDLTDAEVARLSVDLGAILGYVAQLGDGPPPAAEVEAGNRFRVPGTRTMLSDEARTANASEHEGGAFRVPQVI